MFTFLMFLLFALVLFGILSVIAIFVHTAMILLPWTISATCLGAVAGLAVGLKVPIAGKSQPLLGALVAAVLTFGFAFAGLALVPAKAPPVNQLDLIKTTDAHIAENAPVHFLIASLIGGIGVAFVVKKVSPKRLVLELDEDNTTQPATA